MIVGTATYTVEIQGLELPNIELCPLQPDIGKIKLERKANEPLSIEFSLTNVFAQNEAKNITEPVLESILNYLAFEFNVRVGEPKLVQLLLPQDGSSSSICGESNFDILRRVTRQDVIPTKEQLTPTIINFKPTAQTKQSVLRLPICR